MVRAAGRPAARPRPALLRRAPAQNPEGDSGDRPRAARPKRRENRPGSMVASGRAARSISRRASRDFPCVRFVRSASGTPAGCWRGRGPRHSSNPRRSTQRRTSQAGWDSSIDSRWMGSSGRGMIGSLASRRRMAFASPAARPSLARLAELDGLVDRGPGRDAIEKEQLIGAHPQQDLGRRSPGAPSVARRPAPAPHRAPSGGAECPCTSSLASAASRGSMPGTVASVASSEMLA